MSESKTITVCILDKEYRIACAVSEESGLKAAAEYLDQHMRQIRQTGKVIGVDRVAIMAALQMAFELINQHQGSTPASSSFTTRLQKLTQRLNESLVNALPS